MVCEWPANIFKIISWIKTIDSEAKDKWCSDYMDIGESRKCKKGQICTEIQISIDNSKLLITLFYTNQIDIFAFSHEYIQ